MTILFKPSPLERVWVRLPRQQKSFGRNQAKQWWPKAQWQGIADFYRSVKAKVRSDSSVKI